MADRCIQGGRRNRIRLSAPEFVRAALRLAVGFALGWPAIGRAMEPLQAPDVRPWSAAVATRQPASSQEFTNCLKSLKINLLFLTVKTKKFY